MSRAAALLIVALVLMLVVLHARARALGALCGVWTGSPEFLERAQLADMQLYIGRHEAYLYMAAHDGSILADTPIVLDISSLRMPTAAGSLLLAPLALQPRVRFALRTNTPPLPADWLAADLCGSELTLSSGDVVYAHLHRDSIASAAAAAQKI
jgi:hypothetical protein